MDKQHFHVLYCYGSQENFLKALGEGNYEKAGAILERVPHGSTVIQEVERQVLLKEGYCMLMRAYNRDSNLSRLKDINVANADDLEKLVAGHQALCKKFEEWGGKVRGVEDVYTKAIELFNELESELEYYRRLGDPDDVEATLRNLD